VGSTRVVVNLWFRFGTVAANFMVVNLLWMICSLPIVTILPSFAALFGTVRQWRGTGEGGVLGVYFRQWRLHARQSYLAGGPIVVVGLCLAYESAYYASRHDPVSVLMMAMVVCAGFLLVTTWSCLWTLMAAQVTPTVDLLHLAFRYGLRLAPRTLLVVVPVWVIAVGLSYVLPLVLFVGIIPIAVWFHELWIGRGIERLNARLMS